jgi:hypothetical protein
MANRIPEDGIFEKTPGRGRPGIKVAKMDWMTKLVSAVAYDKYQRCGIKGARRLLVTGW